jgi:orotate phosphoribosyltransferase
MSEHARRAAQVLEEVGAIVTDSHVVYTSGKHGRAYVNKDALYPHAHRTAELCGLMADLVRDAGAEVVCAPALGGIILSQWLGHHLHLPAVYAEKVESGLALRRGYDQVVAGRRVVVVEDVVTTGGSLIETIRVVRAAGGTVVAAVALCNRGGLTAADLDVTRFESLLELTLESWEAHECPLCREGVPINTAVGKGREFLARRA